MSTTKSTEVTSKTTEGTAITHRDIIDMAIRLIDTSAKFLSIVEAESVMADLEDLNYGIMEIISSRIPADRLTMVEGKWYITATTESNEWADALKKYKVVLAASPLDALAGYTAQMLAEVKEEEKRITTLATDPYDEQFANYYKQDLIPIKARREALDAALIEIQRLKEVHGGEIVASDTGLDPAVLETLIASEQGE